MSYLSDTVYSILSKGPCKITFRPHGQCFSARIEQSSTAERIVSVKAETSPGISRAHLNLQLGVLLVYNVKVTSFLLVSSRKVNRLPCRKKLQAAKRREEEKEYLMKEKDRAKNERSARKVMTVWAQAERTVSQVTERERA